MKKYKYFFFDFDGMLCDSYLHTTRAFISALSKFRKTKINEKEAYDYLKISFKDAFEHFKVTNEEIELFNQYHENIHFKPEATLYLPVEKLLSNIIKSGGKNFIYTNRGETLYEYLDVFNIRKYFTDIIINANKPDPNILLDMINKHQLCKEECVVVGDRFLDVEGAYNAHIDGILYDVDSRVFLHHATYVIKRINELYNFIDLPYFIKHNYHTHTTRCNHAVGSDEEYVIEAIKNGYQTLGFSDHVMIPEISKNYEYFDSIGLLKEKYKDQIEIKIALEVEYYPYYIPFYEKLINEKKVDYLIFGNHGTMDKTQKNRSEQISFIDHFEDDEYLNKYYNCLKAALQTNLFKYIAHPDAFLKGYGKWDEKAILLTHQIGKLLQENKVYAELSGSGFRSRKKVLYENQLFPAYPFYEFYKILKEYDITFVLGCDAHAPAQLHDEAIQFITDMAKKLNLKIEEKFIKEEINNG